MKRHGSTVAPNAKEVLLRISDEDHQKRVKERFLAIQKQLRDDGYLGGQNNRILRTGEQQDMGSVTTSFGDEMDVVGGGITVATGAVGAARDLVKVEAKKKRNSNAVLESRAQGKLEVRKRKRKNLPNDSKYCDSKYDPAFTAKLMSDDEDEYDEDGKKTNRFVSRAPLHRSKEYWLTLLELIDLLAAVDAVEDPEPSNKYIVRIRGEAVDVPPKKSTKFANKARRWMVDEAWLQKEENQKYDEESRILESGKAWGDDEDPEVSALKREQIKKEKKAMSDDRKRKTLESAIQKLDPKRAKRAGRKSNQGRGHGKNKELEDEELLGSGDDDFFDDD
ncbi:hypothetical protein H0H81_011169 [Sphagnurus paluster]|uniref:Uncharacterized protein n=1 Tax=Sphagnurus paluster TaxID=117069 RepID=A0A9P7K2D8_9AGAR|nr:hypothetical protein H0H81_011169 [Sphagnurus paluster]